MEMREQGPEYVTHSYQMWCVFTVCKEWLIVVAAFIKRRVAAVTKGWDDKVDDVPLTMIIKVVITRMHQEDSMGGKRCFNAPELNIWIDASSLATRISLEYDGTAVKDVSWL